MKRFIFILSWFLLIPSIAFAEIDLTKLPEGFQAKDFLGDLVEEQIKSAIR